MWVLFGGVALAAASVFVLWQAFKHLDLKIERLGDRLGGKIERLGDRIDKKFDDQRSYFDQKLDDQRKHFDRKLDDQRKYFDQKLDKGFDQLAASIAEVSRLVAGHGEQVRAQEAQVRAQEAQVKAQEKQIDRLSGAVFALSRFGAPGQHQQGEHALEPAASGGAEPPPAPEPGNPARIGL